MADLQRVSEKVRSVAEMSRLELAAEWEAQFGAPAPPRLRAELMRPVLIYRIQENAYLRKLFACVDCQDMPSVSPVSALSQ
jgi:hypothetical protein